MAGLSRLRAGAHRPMYTLGPEGLDMKYTQYFLYTRKRPDRQRIKEEWILQAVESPIRTEVQADGRIKLWTRIAEEGKYLRVILLEDGETVHNAFFDRDFKEEQNDED